LESIRKCIKDIEKTLKYIDNICRPVRLNLKPLPIKELLDRLYFAIEDRCRHQKVRLIEKYRHISCQVMCDRDFLEEAFLHLIVNGLEAMSDGGSLSLESYIDSNNKEVIVKIVDTGTGILSRHINEIFDPFFTTKKDQVGLGLCIAQRIIDAHKAKIEVNSNIGKGTIVTVYFPIIKPGDKDV
jgi:signal transduction histidine kinase